MSIQYNISVWRVLQEKILNILFGFGVRYVTKGICCNYCNFFVSRPGLHYEPETVLPVRRGHQLHLWWSQENPPLRSCRRLSPICSRWAGWLISIIPPGLLKAIFYLASFKCSSQPAARRCTKFNFSSSASLIVFYFSCPAWLAWLLVISISLILNINFGSTPWLAGWPSLRLTIIVIVLGGSANQEDYEEAELGPFDEESSLASQHGDERTEIILAATFLLIVILSFIAWVKLVKLQHSLTEIIVWRVQKQTQGRGGAACRD